MSPTGRNRVAAVATDAANDIADIDIQGSVSQETGPCIFSCFWGMIMRRVLKMKLRNCLNLIAGFIERILRMVFAS